MLPSIKLTNEPASNVCFAVIFQVNEVKIVLGIKLVCVYREGSRSTACPANVASSRNFNTIVDIRTIIFDSVVAQS